MSNCIPCPNVLSPHYSFNKIEPVPSILLPCSSCTRTFRPEALAKHAKVCEKTLMKKRKKFDSAKQRLQGTDILNIPSTSKSGKKETPVKNVVQSKWKDRHADLARTLQAAARKKSDPTVHIKPSDHEQCPHCERYFGPKAYDRHTEWCKEQQIKIKNFSNVQNEARERLQVRTKYRAPLTSKVLTRDKYLPRSRDPSPMSVPKITDEAQKSKMASPLERSSSLRVSGRSRTVVVKNPVTSPRILNENKITHTSSIIDNRNESMSASLHEKTKPKMYPEATPKKKMLVPPRVTVPRNRRIIKGQSGFKLNDTQVNHEIEELYVSSCVIHEPAEKGPSDNNLRIQGMEYLKGSGYVSSDSNLSGSTQQSPTSRSYLDSFLGRKYKRKLQQFSNIETITANEIKDFVDKTIARIDEEASPKPNGVVGQESYTIISGLDIPLSEPSTCLLDEDDLEENKEIDECMAETIECNSEIDTKIETGNTTKTIISYTLPYWRDRILNFAAKQFMQFLRWKSKQKAISYTDESCSNMQEENKDTNFQCTETRIEKGDSLHEPSTSGSSSAVSPNEYIFRAMGSTFCDPEFKIIDSVTDDSYLTSSSSSSCSCDSCRRNQSYMVKINKITEVKDAFTNMDLFDTYIEAQNNAESAILENAKNENLDTNPDLETRQEQQQFNGECTETSICGSNATVNHDNTNSEQSELCCNKCLHYVAANIVEEVVATAQMYSLTEKNVDFFNEHSDCLNECGSENLEEQEDTILKTIKCDTSSNMDKSTKSELISNFDLLSTKSDCNTNKSENTVQEILPDSKTLQKERSNISEPDDIFDFWDALFVNNNDSAPPSSLSQDSVNEYLESQERFNFAEDIMATKLSEFLSQEPESPSGQHSLSFMDELNWMCRPECKGKLSKTLDAKLVQTDLTSFNDIFFQNLKKGELRKCTQDNVNNVNKNNLVTWTELAKKAVTNHCSSPSSESTQSLDRDSLEFDNCYFIGDNAKTKEKVENNKNKNFIRKVINHNDNNNIENKSLMPIDSLEFESFAEDAYTSSDWDCSSSNWHEERDNFTVHRKKVKYYETIEYKQDMDDYKTVKTSIYELPPLKTVPKLNSSKDSHKQSTPQYPPNLESSNWPHHHRVLEKNRMKRKSGCLSTIKLPPLKKPSSSSCLTRAAGEGDSLKTEGSRFCHECGSRYPVPMAKFCCNCGIRRIAL
ncbi:uncharacterized protein LOC106670126 isoform X2 [Cimex lectularius]|uniref:C2HC/C3H-type domain-containing protein n=1 Tax=Cimex lectularius TaxID=79782 RepID=A0A8I6S448_CIMLE|nr:uncharacterized protein LOC106670126 isoform X2 [Cimex lectularius]